MLITLADLRTQARYRSNMEKSKLVSDAELNTYINSSAAELYDLLTEAYGSEYFTISALIPVVPDQTMYDLPDGTLYDNAPAFYELKGVDLQIAGQSFINVRQFNFNERNRFGDFSVWDLIGITNVRYRLINNSILFSPKPDRSATLRIWYVPLPPALVEDTDTLDVLNSYSEYVIVDAAIKMLVKEESDVSTLQAHKEMLRKRIVDKSAKRDAAIAPSVADIYAENDDYYWKNGF